MSLSDQKDQQEAWVDILEAWLGTDKKGDIQAYATAFEEQDVNSVERLALLTSSDLAALGVSVGHRPIILQKAREYSGHFKPPSTWELICGRFGLMLYDTNTVPPTSPVKEILSWPLWRGVIGEFWASFIFVFLLNAVIVASGLLEFQNPGLNTANLLTLDPTPTGRISTARYLSISIGAGFAFALANYTFWPSSGGHITPAISFAFLFTRHITFLRWILYLAAQLLGAIIGSGFVKTVNYGYFDAAGGGVNSVHKDLFYDDGISVGVDTLTTFILCIVALSFYDTRRSPSFRWFGHLALGFVFTTVHLIALPINGASMNPARSFASAAIFHSWAGQWTWWLGPGMGAVIAAIWYEVAIRYKDADAWGKRRK